MRELFCLASEFRAKRTTSAFDGFKLARVTRQLSFKTGSTCSEFPHAICGTLHVLRRAPVRMCSCGQADEVRGALAPLDDARCRCRWWWRRSRGRVEPLHI